MSSPVKQQQQTGNLPCKVSVMVRVHVCKTSIMYDKELVNDSYFHFISLLAYSSFCFQSCPYFHPHPPPSNLLPSKDVVFILFKMNPSSLDYESVFFPLLWALSHQLSVLSSILYSSFSGDSLPAGFSPAQDSPGLENILRGEVAGEWLQLGIREKVSDSSEHDVYLTTLQGNFDMLSSIHIGDISPY